MIKDTLRLSGSGRYGKDRGSLIHDSRLRMLLSHAYETVPYYRRLFKKNGLKPEDIRGVADISLIPVTRRRDIRDIPVGDLISSRYKPQRLICRLTHGSTGEPLTVRRTWLEERFLQTLRRRAYRALGVCVKDRHVMIFSPSIPQPMDRKYIHHLIQITGLYREKFINAYLDPEMICQAIADIGPDVISGYPNVLAEIALRLNGQAQYPVHPRLVISGGDTLTPPIKRNLEESFRVPVYDVYGCHEFNLIGWQCRESGLYHVNNDGLIVEVIRDGRPVSVGEEGTLIGTSLYSFSMPFIRYSMDDIVTKGPDTCECGRAFSTIKRIQGREVDYFQIPGEGFIHPYEIVDRALNLPWINRYHIQQEMEGSITISIVPGRRPLDSEIKSIEVKTVEMMRNAVRCRVVLMEDMDSGKKVKGKNYRSFFQSS